MKEIKSITKTDNNKNFIVDWENKGVKDRIRSLICKNATDDEFSQFVGLARSFSLNPFKREIHFIKYGDKANIVIGYEVYLKRAERTGCLDGWEVSLNRDPETRDIEGATIIIHRKDRNKPFIWTVERNEFDTGKSIWLKKPAFMIKKVAIGQGFRLCFPEDLGGMPYMAEELPDTADFVPPKEIEPEEGMIKDVEVIEEVIDEVEKPESPTKDEIDEEEIVEKSVPEKESKDSISGEKVTKITDAFKKFNISLEELETITKRKSSEWNEPVREWLEEKWFQLDDGELDKDQVLNVEFNG